MINIKKSINKEIIVSVSSILVIIMIIANLCIFITAYNQMISINKNNMGILLSQIYQNYKNMITIQINDAAKVSANTDVVNFLKKGRENNVIDNKERIDLCNELKTVSTDPSFCENIFVTDSNGIVNASSNSDFINYDMSHFDYVRNALSGKNCFSDIYTSSITSKPVVTFIFPVKDKEGHIIGTAGKSEYAYYFSNQFDNFKFLNKGYIFIVNNTNNIIYHPDKYYINKKTDIKEIQNIFKNKNTLYIKNAQNIQYVSNGNNYFSEYISVPELKCIVFLTVPKQQIILESSRSGFIISGMALVMIVCVVFILKLLINKFLKPMKILMNNTMQINEGNLVIKNEVTSEDELGQLAVCFNYMVESIKKFIFDIKKMFEEIKKINEMLNYLQENTFKNMNLIKNKSSIIIGETKKINKSIDYSYSSFLKMSSSISDINNKMLSMTNQANKINIINSESITSISELKNINTQVNKSIDEVNMSFNEVTINLNDIKEIVKLVSRISKTINILSLNAAIEAANAGEYGNGFRVVADEIKGMSFDVAHQMEKIVEIVNSTCKNINLTSNKLGNVNEVSKIQNKSIDNTIENHERILKSSGDILNHIDNISCKMKELSSEKDITINVLKEVSKLTKNFNDSICNVSDYIEKQYVDMQSIVAIVEKLNGVTCAAYKEICKYKVE